MIRRTLGLGLLLFGACGVDPVAPLPGASTDAGTVPDAAAPAPDAGASVDAGAPSADAGTLDAGSIDGGATAPDVAPKVPPDYARVYDPTRVPRIELHFTPEAWAALEQNRRENEGVRFDDRNFEYVPATVAFDGETRSAVGVRYKGNSSFGVPGPKRSLKLDFEEYQADNELLGLQKLNLNNGFKDPSLLRECLALDLFRAVGVPAPRCNHVEVYVDDGSGLRRLGVYNNVENVDKRFLRDRFGDDQDGGNLYKPDGPGADLSSFVESSFEKKTNEEAADYSDVQAFIRLLATHTSPDAIRANLGPVFDVDGFLRYLAMNVVLTNWDSYAGSGHNYYLYNRAKDGQGTPSWVFIPWDVNEAFGSFRPGGASAESMLTWAPERAALDNRKVLIERVLAVPEWRATYLAYVADFAGATGPFGGPALVVEIDRMAALVAPFVYADPNYLFSTANPDLFADNVERDVNVGRGSGGGPGGTVLGIESYVAARAAFLADWTPN